MAKLFPDSEHTRVIFASRAEEAFYEACQELSDSWRVYFSRTLSTMECGKGLQDNEIDFVLYHPSYGVAVVEVKGGRIQHSVDSGHFYSINRFGESFQIKDPFQQALVWKSRFLRELRRRDIKVPVSHVVCLPSVLETDLQASASLVPEIVIGRQRITALESSLKKIIKASQPEKFLQFDDVADPLHDLLWGRDFTTRLFLKDYLKSNDLRVKDIEHIQETLVQPIAATPRLGVEGEAGTGKTILAMLLAQKFRNEGKKVLFLSSNRLLNESLKRQAGPDITLKTYVEFGDDYGVPLLKPLREYEGSREDWTQYEAPDRLIKAIESSQKRYHVLICDEAQDVQPFWWDALEKVLAVDDSVFYIFFDRSQGVFGSGQHERGFVPEEVLPIAAPYFPLVYNYRTTREIAGFARGFRTGRSVLQSHCGRLGYIPELIVYDDRDDCRRRLGQLFRKLFREEELTTGDVTLLSARQPRAEESVIGVEDSIAKYPIHFLSPDRKSRNHTVPGKVNLCTITGFKGMETSVAILLNLSEHKLPVENPIMASLIYVACTRAKHMLYIMVQKDDPKRKVFENALHAIKTTGSMVLEGSEANFEFVGTVSYFNPERIGWMVVNDPSFEKNNIMFFPHDVRKAGLRGEAIKPGLKLRFRPNAEGHSTIATDLKLIKSHGGSAA